MKSTAYIETSIISYLVARPSRDLFVAARQQLTSEWWIDAPDDFTLVTSQVVIEEIGRGDPIEAAKRASALRSVSLLRTSPEVDSLAATLVRGGVLPPKASKDALHIATAAIHNVEYLVTWNCRHIANATIRPRVERLCSLAGYKPPIICTPEQLTKG